MEFDYLNTNERFHLVDEFQKFHLARRLLEPPINDRQNT